MVIIYIKPTLSYSVQQFRLSTRGRQNSDYVRVQTTLAQLFQICWLKVITYPYFEEHIQGTYEIFTITAKEHSCIYRPVTQIFSQLGSHS